MTSEQLACIKLYNENMITIRNGVLIEKELDCEVSVEIHDFAKFKVAIKSLVLITHVMNYVQRLQ